MEEQSISRRIIGCGKVLIGKPWLFEEKWFRIENNGTYYTEVKYLFFTLFYIPIWPIGCYRVQGSRIIKKESAIKKEILRIYFFKLFLIPLAVFVSILMLLHFVSSD